MGRGTPRLSLRVCLNIENAEKSERAHVRETRPNPLDKVRPDARDTPGRHKRIVPLGARPGYLDTRPGETVLEMIPGKQNVPVIMR